MEELIETLRLRAETAEARCQSQIQAASLPHRDTPQTFASPEGQYSASSCNGGDTQLHHSVPLPRQIVFDGKTSWDSFIKPFQSLADACNWSTDEKLFRLCSSLRNDAAEYAFVQLPPQNLTSYELLEKSLASRFRERRTVTSYLSELENVKLDSKTKLTEYVATIRKLVLKGYPTADEMTRETIGLRYFLKGLPDQQMSVTVGMRDPRTIDEAQTAVETYNSLKDEVGKSVRVRSTQAAECQDDPNTAFVTEGRLQAFGKQITNSMDRKFGELKSLLKSSQSHQREGNTRQTGGQFKRRDMSTVECFRCHEYGHYAKNCSKSGVNSTQREAVQSPANENESEN